MKILKSITILLITTIFLTGCKSDKYVGYWCNYEETATIVVTLEENNTQKQRTAIEKVIGNFNNISSYDFIESENFVDDEDGTAYDTYFVYFTENTANDEHVMALEKLSGVQKVEQHDVKTNVSLYEFVDKKKYKFQDGIDVEEKHKITGTYKITDDSLNLSSPTKSVKLYIKNDYLCADSACNVIFTKSDEKCEKIVEN